MTSLPLISHHLFVAAIGHEDHLCAQSTRQESWFSRPACPARVIPLEVVDGTEPMPGERLRPLRAAVTGVKG